MINLLFLFFLDSIHLSFFVRAFVHHFLIHTPSTPVVILIRSFLHPFVHLSGLSISSPNHYCNFRLTYYSLKIRLFIYLSSLLHPFPVCLYTIPLFPAMSIFAMVNRTLSAPSPSILPFILHS